MTLVCTLNIKLHSIISSAQDGWEGEGDEANDDIDCDSGGGPARQWLPLITQGRDCLN